MVHAVGGEHAGAEGDAGGAAVRSCGALRRNAVVSSPGGGVEDVVRSTALPSSSLPASIGPPLTNRVGMLQRTAARHAGHDLVAVGNADHAVEAVGVDHRLDASAISSRLGSENFMPAWPMAIRRRRRSC